MMAIIQASSAAVALVVILYYFLLFNDFVTARVGVPRNWIIQGHRYRSTLIAIAILALILAFGLNFMTERFSLPFAICLLLAGLLGLYLANFVIPLVMLRSQHHSARFVEQSKSNLLLRDFDEVFVVVNNDDVRAFPHDWMVQPHVAGDLIGGDNVVLTVCGLSHLGLAYRTEVGGKATSLKVLNQIDNNLVVYDANSTALPIQQIYGISEDGQLVLDPIPTLLMPYSSFKALFPRAFVYFNPPANAFDKLQSSIMLWALGKQHREDRPMSPMRNLPEDADILPKKAKVYSYAFGGEAAAWTLDLLKREKVIFEVVGGREILFVYHVDFDFVSCFARPDSVDRLSLMSGVNPYGRTADGRTLERLPFASLVFWMVWKRFYPETILNR